MSADDEITLTEDLLDSRNIQERIDWLTRAFDDKDEWNDDLDTELIRLEEFKENADFCGWDNGATFINSDYFEDYARDFAEDIGAIENEAHWPATCIDWEQAADELKIDYSCVDGNETTYYYLCQ